MELSKDSLYDLIGATTSFFDYDFLVVCVIKYVFDKAFSFESSFLMNVSRRSVIQENG